MTATFISLAEEFARIAGSAEVLGDPSGTPAYLYTRSSNKIQAMEGRESLARQLIFGHEKALADGHYIPLDMTYWDIWRGKDADRPELHRLLSDVKQNKRSDLVYIDQTDRLSRSMAVYYVLLHDLTRHGLTVRFESEEDDLVRHIKLAFDEIELEKKRYRQIQSNKARATKGYVTNTWAAFGYKFGEDRRTYVIDEDKAIWVKRVFDWYVAGKSLRWIAMELTNAGVPTALRAERWRLESVRRMLQHEVYKGTYIANRYQQEWVWEAGKQKKVHSFKPEDEWIYIQVPAIVSEEQWEEAQRILATNKKNSLRNARKHEWLLTGLLRCVCDHAMVSKFGRSTQTLASGEAKTYEYPYYTCGDHGRAVPPYTCEKGMIAKHRIEAHVLEALELLIQGTDIWDQVWESHSEQVAQLQQRVTWCQKQVEELDRQLRELLQIALEQRADATRRLFLEKQVELEHQRQSFEEQRKIAQERLLLTQQAANQRKMVEQILTNLRSVGGITQLPFELQRRLLTQLVDEIVLDTEERWFEIRGVLSEVHGVSGDQFSYAENGQVVTRFGVVRLSVWTPNRSMSKSILPAGWSG